MNANNGNTLLNVVFGIFMMASIIKVGMDLHERFRKKKDGLTKEQI
ncbi:hypothetical protein [uncultured Dokdonia sp.]|nr:hypothetical protein [uncultured Dokdonia sp.]